MAISNIQLGVTETSLLTATLESAIISILFCNTSTTDKTVTIYAYPSGGSAGDGSTILKDLTIPAGDTFIWSGQEKIILDVGDVVSGLADVATSVTATINYKTI